MAGRDVGAGLVVVALLVMGVVERRRDVRLVVCVAIVMGVKLIHHKGCTKMCHGYQIGNHITIRMMQRMTPTLLH